jgi:hypothetical protein
MEDISFTFRPEGSMSRHLILPALLLSLLTPSIGSAQTYVTTTAHRVPFDRVDSLRKLLKETRTVTAEVKRLGGVLDDMWLIHAWGGEHNVVQVTTWKSWAAITDTTLGFNAATKKAYPDSVARKKINDRFDWVFNGVPHIDNIYQKAE